MRRNNLRDFTLNLKHCFARPKMKELQNNHKKGELQ